MHQVEKLKRAKQVEAEPPLAIDDRHRPPRVGREIKGRRLSRLVYDVSGKAMERQDQENGETAQIS